ncbi:MAG TPA: hypothetical protein VHT73_04685 [Thermodesulfobacteriota bacterium]|nr:hypothetical protein [Thermodesulfobacteriota bacterium]
MDPFRDPAVREAMRRAQEIREIMDNPAFRRIQEIHQQYGHLFDHWNRIVNSPEFQIFREAQERLRGLNTFIASPAFIAARDFLMQNDVALRIINSPEWGAMLEAQMRQRDLLTITNWTTAIAIAEISQYISNNIYFGFFPQSFAAEILDTLLSIEEPTDEQRLQDFIAKLENLLALIISKCKELATNPTTYWAMVKLTITIFTFLYPLYEGQRAEKRIIDFVNQTRTEILKEVEKLKPTEIREVYYVVVREVKLKSHPRPKSATIQILSPNQRVKLIQAKGKWIYVEYFDYIEGIPKTGWVLKKYTKRLEN